MDGAKRKGARYVPALRKCLVCSRAPGRGRREVDLPRRLQRLITEAIGHRRHRHSSGIA